MKKKIRQLFHIWQGHQITDEKLYNTEKRLFPVVTGHNHIKGYVESPFITDVPCITIPSKGVVNKLYLQESPFNANNTIALVPKDRKEIDLEYVIFTQSNHITSFISSINTNNYLNKAILEDIEIEYPDIDIQIEIKEQFKELLELKVSIEIILDKLSNQIVKNIKTV